MSIVFMPDGDTKIETVADQLRAEVLARLNMLSGERGTKDGAA